MNRYFRVLLALALMVGLTGPARAVLPIEQWHTPGGVKVLFMRADAIPMLDIAVRFDAGGRLDEFAGTGVAAMTASMLDAGAGDRNEAQMADAFARIGAQRSAGAGDDSASVSLRTVLSEPELDQALLLFEDMLARPRFEESAVKREKQRMLQALRNGASRASFVARRAYLGMAYGDHPYGLQLTQDDVSNLTASKLREFHRNYYVRTGTTIAMIGAIDRARAEDIAARLDAALPATGKAVPPLAPVQLLSSAQEKRIEHPGAQSHILIGAPLLARGDPDYYALLLANNVLGGASFVSRLYKEVREKRGLTYGVSSGFSLKAQLGLFTINLQTQRERTAEALRVVRRVLNEFVQNGPTDKELEAARSNLVGGFVFRIDSNRKILRLMSAIGFHDLGLDYLERWVERINAVSLDEVRDALKRRIRPAEMVTIVVGETKLEEN